MIIFVKYLNVSVLLCYIGRKEEFMGKYAILKIKWLPSDAQLSRVAHCSNQSPLALCATAVNAAAVKQPRHEIRLSTWLGECRAQYCTFSPERELMFRAAIDEYR